MKRPHSRNRNSMKKRVVFSVRGSLRNMGRPAIVGLMAAWLCLLLPGCGESVIRIGFMADLSGRGSGSGIAARNGAMLAVDEINAQGGIGGKRVVLHIKDDKGIAAEAERVDRELIEEGIVLAVGHLNSGPGIPGVKLLLEAGIPVVSPAMGAKSLTGIQDGFFRVVPVSVDQGRVVAGELIRQTSVGATAALLLEENNLAYGETVAEGFRDEWEASGRKTATTMTYLAGPDAPFDEVVERLAQTGSDAFLLIGGGLDLAVYTQKIRARMPDALIASGMWGMTNDFLQQAGRAGEGVVFPHVYLPSSTSIAWNRFMERYRDVYSVEPIFSSGTAYEAVKIACMAIGKAASLNKEDLEASLLAHSPYEGLQGAVEFDAYGDCLRGYVPVVVRNSRFLEVRP